MPQKGPAIGEDVTHLFSGGSVPAVGEDVTHLFASAGGLYDTKRKPASPEDFTVEPSKGWPAKIGDYLIGGLKGVGSTAAGIAETAVNAGAIPGVLPSAFNPDMRHPLFRKTDELTTATNPDQQIGKNVEFVGELALPALEAGKAGLAFARAVPGAARKVLPAVAEALASDKPLLAQARSAVAKKILGHVLDSATTPANAGGRLVAAGSRPSAEAELASALDELRAPSPAPSVELPPPAELPPGYVPRTEAPPVVPSPNAGGRIVPSQTPTTEQALADALAETRVPDPPARVTTPPEASLPPGYTPRATVPKPKAAKAKLPPQVEEAMAAGERKRAYFLKPKEELAAVAEAAVEQTGSLTVGDLPASWRSHTGQDLFPITGEEGKAVIDGLRAELKARGMSTGQAIASVSKNRSLPTALRAQLLRALSGGK